MRRPTSLAMAIVLIFAPASIAQTAHSFEELSHLTARGEAVYLVDAAGSERRVRIFDVSPQVLDVVLDGTRRTLRQADVSRIERRRKDPVWNGVLMGTAAGGLVGFAQGRRLDSPSCPSPGRECGQGALIGATSGALWGGVAGWIVDALVRRREVIYATPDRGLY